MPCFKAVDIEELRGMEFHHKVQKDELIEDLGLELQALGCKAFPSIQGQEFERLLKGRFFQALHDNGKGNWVHQRRARLFKSSMIGHE